MEFFQYISLLEEENYSADTFSFYFLFIFIPATQPKKQKINDIGIIKSILIQKIYLLNDRKINKYTIIKIVPESNPLINLLSFDL